MSSQDGGGAITKGNDTVYNKIAVSQTTITAGATLVVAASSLRAKLCLFNTATAVPIFVGPTDSVTTSNGFGIPPLQCIEWPYAGALYGIVAAATQDLSIAEIQT